MYDQVFLKATTFETVACTTGIVATSHALASVTTVKTASLLPFHDCQGTLSPPSPPPELVTVKGRTLTLLLVSQLQCCYALLKDKSSLPKLGCMSMHMHKRVNEGAKRVL